MCGEGEGDGDAVARRDAGDSGAGGVGVGRDGDGVDQAEVDDVEGDVGVVAVAQGGEDVGFGESGRHGCWFDDSFSRFETELGWGMKILTSDVLGCRRGPAEWFTGTVWVDDVVTQVRRLGSAPRGCRSSRGRGLRGIRIRWGRRCTC